MSDLMQEIQTLIEPNLRKRVYVAFYHLIKEQNLAAQHIPEHLRYMGSVDHKIMMSGPMVVDGQLVGEGMTIFRSDNKAEIIELLNDEPFIKAGIRTYDLKLWEIREGSLQVALRFTDKSFDLGE